MKTFDFLHGLVLSVFLSFWLCISYATPVNNIQRYINIENEVNGNQQRCPISVSKLPYTVNHRRLLHDLDDNNEFTDTDQQNNVNVGNITERTRSAECCSNKLNQDSLTQSVPNNDIEVSSLNKNDDERHEETSYSTDNSQHLLKPNEKEIHPRRKRSLNNSKDLNKNKENEKRSISTKQSEKQDSSISSKSSSPSEQESDNKAVDNNPDENESLVAGDAVDYVADVDGGEYQKNQIPLGSNDDSSINQDEKSFYDEFEGKEIVKRDTKDGTSMDYEGAKADEDENEETANDNRVKRDGEIEIKFTDESSNMQLPKGKFSDERNSDLKVEEETAARNADNVKGENDNSKISFVQETDIPQVIKTDKISSDESNRIYEKNPIVVIDKKPGTELSKNVDNEKTENKQQNLPVVSNQNIPVKSDSKNMAQANGDESEVEYEKRVEEQIQQKIDSIKEEIKREIEAKQRLREIEENNAKFDELQRQMEETEERQNLVDQKNEPQQVASKRSTRNLNKLKRKRSSKRIKRTEQERNNERELQKIENVDHLNPEVFQAALANHESIRKRSAARFYENERSPVKKRVNARRIYLVEDGYPSGRRRKRRSRNLSSNSRQTRSKADDNSSANLNLYSRFRGNGNERKVRGDKTITKRIRKRKGGENTIEGGTNVLKYSPENINEDDDEEGNEFDDDGFEDRTSNLRSWNSDDRPRNVKRNRRIYKIKARSTDYPEDFLFSGFRQKPHLARANRKRNKR